MTLPLDGFTVVAIEQAVAAPLATRNLADLGARVIKVERIDGGDLARGYDHVVEGTGAHFVWLNRGKESIAVDLKSQEGRAVVRRLVDRADVFLQNLAPGAVERLGFGADELRSRRTELVVVNLSGFGTGGPMGQRKAYDMLIQAEAGLISITGTPETPVKTGIPTADIAAGMYASQAVLAALLRRCRTGEGATIDVSMLDATVEWMGHAMYTQMYTGSQPPRMGLSHSSIAPYNAFPTGALSEPNNLRCRRSYHQPRSVTSRLKWVMFRRSVSTPMRCSWNRDWTRPAPMTPLPAGSLCRPNASNPPHHENGHSCRPSTSTVDHAACSWPPPWQGQWMRALPPRPISRTLPVMTPGSVTR